MAWLVCLSPGITYGCAIKESELQRHWPIIIYSWQCLLHILDAHLTFIIQDAITCELLLIHSIASQRFSIMPHSECWHFRREVLFLSPFHRWGNWDTRSLNYPQDSTTEMGSVKFPELCLPHSRGKDHSVPGHPKRAKSYQRRRNKGLKKLFPTSFSILCKIINRRKAGGRGGRWRWGEVWTWLDLEHRLEWEWHGTAQDSVRWPGNLGVDKPLKDKERRRRKKAQTYSPLPDHFSWGC